MSMKRSGTGARDSPTKDRYAKRQQQHPGRGGRRQKPGSRDVSPAPPSWGPQTAPAAQTTHSPAPTPHQIALQQQHLLETAAKTPVSELILQIKRLTFPSSCTFVLSLLEKYVKANLTNDTILKISLPKKGPLLILLNYFVLCQLVSVKVTGKKNKVEQKPTPYSALEELQVMMSVVKKIEEQNNVEQQFYIFEALFGGCVGTIKAGVRAGETFFERVVFLAVSLQSCPVLSCVALWLQTHPSEALSLSHSLYSSFCEHLPDASEPLELLASLCPHLAQQLTIAYTSLHPFHIVGTPVPGVDSAHLQPPRQLVTIISNWLENTPQFLYAARPIDKTDLLSFHGTSKATHPASPPCSPLAGLMQWCILAPCHHTKSSSEDTSKKTSKPHESSKGMVFPSMDSGKETVSTVEEEKEKEEGSKQGVMVGDEEMNFQTLVSKLHANLLSVILSDSQLFPHETLTSDHVAVTVAALLGLSHHQPLAQLKKRGKPASAEEDRQRDGERDGELEESVERLAQFLQISLSTGLLALSAENLSSMASTLPNNKLLTLVIAHHSTRR